MKCTYQILPYLVISGLKLSFTAELCFLQCKYSGLSFYQKKKKGGGGGLEGSSKQEAPSKELLIKYNELRKANIHKVMCNKLTDILPHEFYAILHIAVMLS